MIRIDAMWLAAEPVDMRAGADRLLMRVVQVFGAANSLDGADDDFLAVLERLTQLGSSCCPTRW